MILERQNEFMYLIILSENLRTHFSKFKDTSVDLMICTEVKKTCRYSTVKGLRAVVYILCTNFK